MNENQPLKGYLLGLDNDLKDRLFSSYNSSSSNNSGSPNSKKEKNNVIIIENDFLRFDLKKINTSEEEKELLSLATSTSNNNELGSNNNNDIILICTYISQLSQKKNNNKKNEIFNYLSILFNVFKNNLLCLIGVKDENEIEEIKIIDEKEKEVEEEEEEDQKKEVIEELSKRFKSEVKYFECDMGMNKNNSQEKKEKGEINNFEKVIERVMKLLIFAKIDQKKTQIVNLEDELNIKNKEKEEKEENLKNLLNKCLFYIAKVTNVFNDKSNKKDKDFLMKKLNQLKGKIERKLENNDFRDESIERDANKIFQKVRIKEFKKYKIIINFGKSVNETLSVEKNGEENCQVPEFLHISLKYISEHHMYDKDLFYKECALKKLNEMKKKFNNGISVHLPKISIQVLTSLIKAWLNELPIPLIENYSTLLKYFKEKNLILFKEMFYKLPKINFLIVRELFLFLLLASKECDKNKLTTTRIGRIFGNFLFFKKDHFKNLENEKMENLQKVFLEIVNTSLSEASKVIELMVENAEDLFNENYEIEKKKVLENEYRRRLKEKLEKNIEDLNWEKVENYILSKYSNIFSKMDKDKKNEKFDELKTKIVRLSNKISNSQISKTEITRLTKLLKEYKEFCTTSQFVDDVKKMNNSLFKDKELLEVINIFNKILKEKKKKKWALYNTKVNELEKSYNKHINKIYGGIESIDKMNVYKGIYSKFKDKNKVLTKVKFKLQNQIEDDIIEENEVIAEKKKIEKMEIDIKGLMDRLKEFEDNVLKKYYKVYENSVKEEFKSFQKVIQRELFEKDKKEKNANKRKVKQASKKHFFCPLTKKVMRVPVILVESGVTYEKHAILSYLEKHDVDPTNGKKLITKEIIRNTALRTAALSLRII